MDAKRFDTVHKEVNTFDNTCSILVDRETGVNYLFVKTGQAGGLTVLLDAEGKPVVTPQFKE